MAKVLAAGVLFRADGARGLCTTNARACQGRPGEMQREAWAAGTP